MASIVSAAVCFFTIYWTFRLFKVLFKIIKIRIEEAEQRLDKYEKYNRNKNYHNKNAKYSQTGWTWNENTQRWNPPGYKEPEIKVNRSEPTYEEWKTKQKQGEAATEDINYRETYQAKQLFTKNEWQNYKKLRDVAEVKGYVICPKVRLLDIIEPRKGEKKYKTLFYKIQAKHVDFVICDQNMNIKAIVELDDSSHNRQDRKERDDFVDLILRSVGYKVIHTKYIDYNILDLV